jgi:hypothetical protein
VLSLTSQSRKTQNNNSSGSSSLRAKKLKIIVRVPLLYYHYHYDHHYRHRRARHTAIKQSNPQLAYFFPARSKKQKFGVLFPQLNFLFAVLLIITVFARAPTILESWSQYRGLLQNNEQKAVEFLSRLKHDSNRQRLTF